MPENFMSIVAFAVTILWFCALFVWLFKRKFAKPQTAKAKVRFGEENTREVPGMLFSYDEEKVNAVIADTYKMEGIYYIKVWLNEGELSMGDDIMYVLIGGDIRPRVVDALQYLVGRVKNECVVETELN